MDTQVQDVDFKEIQNSKMIDGREQPPKAYRILHVQVQGNPSTEDLNSVAQSFQQALQSGSDSVVTTTNNVQVFNIYEEGQAPFNGVLVRGALTLNEIARTVHDAQKVAEDQPFKHWFDLTDEERAQYVRYVQLELRGKLVFNSEDPKPVLENLIKAVVIALKPALPAPQLSNLKPVQLWNGSIDPADPLAWTDADFMSIKNTMVFRYADNPETYLCAVGDIYTNYDGPTSFVSVDTIQVVPHLTEDPEPKLEWRIKQAQSPAVPMDLEEPQVDLVGDSTTTATEQ